MGSAGKGKEKGQRHADMWKEAGDERDSTGTAGRRVPGGAGPSRSQFLFVVRGIGFRPGWCVRRGRAITIALRGR